MTITNPTRVVTAAGNGATTVFPYPFLIPALTDMEVSLYDTVSGITTPIDQSQYSVTGIGNEDGGNVTYPLTGAPLTSTVRISIFRTMPYEQTLDVDGENAYNPALLESQLDKIVMQIQQVAEQVGRAVTAPAGSGISAENYFQTLATFADQQVDLIDAAGSDALTAIAADKTAAAASATAAAASETNAAASAASAAADAASVAPLADQIIAAPAVAFTAPDMLVARRNSDGALIRLSWEDTQSVLAGTFLPLAGGNMTGDLSLGGHALAAVASINGGPFGGYRNKLINGNFSINQLALSGTVTLTAGEYGHDGWRAGAAGCTYTFAIAANVTTLTISAGSLQQVVEGANLFSGTHTLSWAGTAQGKIGAGAYGGSGVTGAATGGTNLTVEFSTGTLSLVQLEFGAAASMFEQRRYADELALCQRYFYWPTRAPFLVVPGTGSAEIPVEYPVPLYAAPTISYGSLTDANYVNSSTPTGTQWSMQSIGNSTTAKTGTFTIGVSQGLQQSLFGIFGATFSNLPNTAIVGSSFVMPKFAARL